MGKAIFKRKINIVLIVCAILIIVALVYDLFIRHEHEWEPVYEDSTITVLECTACGYTAENTDAMELHLEQHAEKGEAAGYEETEVERTDTVLRCTACGYTTTNTNDMGLHLKQHAEKGEAAACQKTAGEVQQKIKEYKCSICGEITNSID